MTKEQRYELLEFMDQHSDLTVKDYVREMWLDHGDIFNDIEEALYRIIGILESR